MRFSIDAISLFNDHHLPDRSDSYQTALYINDTSSFFSDSLTQIERHESMKKYSIDNQFILRLLELTNWTWSSHKVIRHATFLCRLFTGVKRTLVTWSVHTYNDWISPLETKTVRIEKREKSKRMKAIACASINSIISDERKAYRIHWSFSTKYILMARTDDCF